MILRRRHSPARISGAALLLAVSVPLALSACAQSDPNGEVDPVPAATSERAATPSSDASATPATADLGPRLTVIEERHGVSLGVFAIDTGDGRTVAHRADERFAHASTIKVFAAGAVLGAAGPEEVDAPILVQESDLVAYSPILEQRVGGSITLREAADAAVRYSDNTAANLLVAHLGGPEALEARLRAAGDSTTSVDRLEPELNATSPDDARDTSTPRALATALEAFALGSVLTADDRHVLIDLLVRNTTGAALVRAAAPQGWTIGDKTGTASWGTRNDIAIAWPPGGGAPIVMALMSRGSSADADVVDAAIAETAGAVFAALGEG